jgi:hypothetical protein
MNYGLLLRTVKHLKPTQVYHQIKYRLVKAHYVPLSAPSVDMPSLTASPITKFKCLEDDKFTFLNLEHEFSGWNYTENGMLWAYNQNYFDWINQESISVEEGCKWIDRFIEELPGNKVGLDPYPIALRTINWVKFLCRYPDCVTKARQDSLYSQLRLLGKKLEYHLLGNHLLEDAFALYIGASFFNDNRLLAKAEKILLSQLKEQILPDGAHYEQSPMYHCILLDRLLDCVNIRNTEALAGYACKMLGHLDNIVWSDGTIPMLNDSANGIAPMPTQIFDYAKRLGLEWNPIPMKESGYRKLQDKHIEAIVDVGNITATYQPGHTHADTFNYEVRIDGKPFVVDTGISTYNKTERRQLERSTMAHNTVSVDGKDSSEVWGGFRVGRRATVSDVRWKMEEGRGFVEASHDGFAKKCRRRFELSDGRFKVEDWYDGDAVSYIHLVEGADENRIEVKGALSVETKPWQYSLEYNKFREGKVIEIRFKGNCNYTIQ